MDGETKSDIARREEEILAFWRKEHVFEKALEKKAPKGEYVFYDGPPFATGLPHYGHIVPSTIKDAIPRYRTMQGFSVRRRWGWDCHGLPLENQIEQELGLKSKRDIEELGVKTFNEAARKAVLRYAEDWKRIIPRLGRWVDMEDDYKTMDTSYTESVWWAFKNLHGRGLVYEGFKAMQLCPRCGTTLSNFEVAQGYKDIEDYAVTLAFPLTQGQKVGKHLTQESTYMLAWTTTPWTLPGNMALAVEKNLSYSALRRKSDGNIYILASGRVDAVFGGIESEVVQEGIRGEELLGLRYEPPFSYFKDSLKGKEKAWRVYHSPHVTVEDGTGIVHIAPAFGEEDLALAQKEKIPIVHHVSTDGTFVAAVTDFAGLRAKPKGDHRATDKLILDHLHEKGLVFKNETISHSYPHCWRCDTPLLNYASSSWFVQVASLKKKLLSENAKITWIPEHVGKGRFHHGLESAPDWAISRSRYWGAPLPVWRTKDKKKIKIVGSIEELLALQKKSGNRYFAMRHGDSVSNSGGYLDGRGDPENHLTDVGKEQVAAAALRLKKEKIDIIVSSPLRRAQQTARIVQKEMGLPDTALMTDERLRELDFGSLNGKPAREWDALFGTFADRFTYTAHGGETYQDVRRRVGDFLFEIERRYTGKTILIVSHGTPLWFIRQIARRTPYQELIEMGEREGYPTTAEWNEIDFTPYPHNDDYDVDLHRPYIDSVTLTENGDVYERIPDVFDCWFESGSMPFASHHYPFRRGDFNPKRLGGLFPKGYPAHFISESLDQTRGWFYSLIVLGTALFGKAPYKTVITNGLVLGADGRKMSKRLKNYPDLLGVISRYGADALRYYLLSSPVIRGEDVAFSERGVDEVAKKITMRLTNVLSFYALQGTTTPRKETSGHVLDRWMIARLRELSREVTEGFEKYELDAATRPVGEFIDDLSTWYVRRSRDRFKKEGKEEAAATLRFVLYNLSHLIAPVMPFLAEHLFLSVRENADPESVHLSHWPSFAAPHKTLLTDMKRTRSIVSRALELRNASGMKVRQPLASLTVKGEPIHDEHLALIRDEINVKDVRLVRESSEGMVLDTLLTPALRAEGMVRDVVRAIQEKRKEGKLHISDRPAVFIAGNDVDAVSLRSFEDEIKSAAQLGKLVIESREGMMSGDFDIRIEK